MKKVYLLLLIVIVTSYCFSQNDDNEPFEIFNERNEDGSVVVFAKNNYLCDESVIIDFSVLKNMQTDVELPFKTIVSAKTKKVKLFTITVINKKKESNLSYVSKNCHGNIFYGKHNDEYIYLLPYQEGETYSLDQGYGGKFSHYIKNKKYGLDFNMPNATPICAARGGIVIAVKDDSNKRGKSIKYKGYGNYITIYHDDGSFSDYYHLQKGGSRVMVGDQVDAGQVIALSGNTGWTSGPHLHFQVYLYNKNMEVETIKTKFLIEKEVGIFLKEKGKYTAVR